MASENGDDDSFIILGTSPGSSLDMRYTGDPVVVDQMTEAMKELPVEANMAFKAHFKLGASEPSPSSMMVASIIITDDKTTEELQKRFGELLDENVILKETLKHNNDSMKEQFLLISSCQDDMLNTHKLHKEKFDETKNLVMRLREENKKLKEDMINLSESQSHSHTNSEHSEPTSAPVKSGPSSALEFVTSPDDEMVNKLTSQLELIEKQRRQVIVDNEKLTWQKESLEHIIDVTTKERDDLKEKVKELELQLSSKDAGHSTEINNLNSTIEDLHKQIETLSVPDVSQVELAARDLKINELESKMAKLLADLKESQLKLLGSENIKLELAQYKDGESEKYRRYKQHTQEIIKNMQIAMTIICPAVNLPKEDLGSTSEATGLAANVNLYNLSLKHLGDILNSMKDVATMDLDDTVSLILTIGGYKIHKTDADRYKVIITELKTRITKNSNGVLANIGQIRTALKIFSGIFNDYQELVKRKSPHPRLERPADNVGALTAALVARGQEIQQLQQQLADVQGLVGNTEAMRAQMELYKSDFEAERECRTRMACEREGTLADLRIAQKKNHEYSIQIDEVRKLHPGVFKMACSKAAAIINNHNAASSNPRAKSSPSANPAHVVNYTCPKCRFASDQLKVIEDHFEICLDDF